MSTVNRHMSLRQLASSPRKNWTMFLALALVMVVTLVTIVVEDRAVSASFVSSFLSTTKVTGGVEEAVQPRRFPPFDDGGVVLFLHIAKTGGTSIRKNFGNFSSIEMKTLFTMEQWDEYADVADRILTRKVPENERRILFLEPHGMRSMGMPTLHKFVRRWRRFANQHNTSFFAFTLVREPVSYAVSYFNFFNAEPCTLPKCPWKLYKPSERALLKTNRRDMQCMLLARDHWDIFSNDVHPTRVDEEECDDVYQTLRADMDWIGTTEDMSTETIPLLTRMLTNNATAANAMSAFNTIKTKKADEIILTQGALSPETVERLQDQSRNDEAIYMKVKRHFPMDMWENFAEV